MWEYAEGKAQCGLMSIGKASGTSDLVGPRMTVS